MKSLDELNEIREKNISQVNLRGDNQDKIRVTVGLATCGIAAGARPVLTALSDAVQEEFLTDKIAVEPMGCIGLCKYEPIVQVEEPGKETVTYIEMTPEKAMEVFNEHLKNGKVVTKYTLNAVQV